MGNLVDIRPDVDPASTAPAGKNWSLSSVGNDRLEPVQPTTDARSASWTLVFRNLTRFARGMTRPTLHPGPDAYTLVLLADQALTAGRDSQAKALLSAAYAAFDQQANCHSRTAANQP